MRRNNATLLPMMTTGSPSKLLSKSFDADDIQVPMKQTNKGNPRLIAFSTKRSFTVLWTLNVVITLVVSFSLLMTHQQKPSQASQEALQQYLENKGQHDPQHVEETRETELSHIVGFDFPPTFRHTPKSVESKEASATETTQQMSIGSFEDTTAIVVISMGDMATNTNLVERCLKSIRTKGNFEGHFVILTDHPERYHTLEEADSLVNILVAKPDDVNVDIEGLSSVMRYKRFKTLLLDYFNDEPKLNSVQRVAYMDYDIVIGRDLSTFWTDMDGMIQKDEEAEALPSSHPSPSYMYFFREDWNKQRREPFHAGIMVLDRQHSQKCLEVWRHEIDAGRVNRDQQGLKLLHDRITNGLEHSCQMRYIEQRDQHLLFPTSESMQNHEYATFIHVTNTKRAKFISASIQKDFFMQLLELDEQEDSGLTEVHIVPKWKQQAKKAKQKKEKEDAKAEAEVHIEASQASTSIRGSPNTDVIIDRVADLVLPHGQ
jgi:hypothetical protein